MEVQNSTENNLVSIKFQVIVAIIITIVMGLPLQKRFFDFRISSIPPEILTINPQSLKKFGSFPNIIKVGLIINDFQKFDIINNDFILDGIIWFELYPDVLSLETLEKFNFEQGGILKKSAIEGPSEVKILDDKLFVSYNIRVQFSSNLNYADFPLDDHRIYLVFSNKSVTPGEIMFEASDSTFIINADLQDDGWDLFDKDVISGYREIDLSPHDPDKITYYPMIVFSMDVIRYGLRYVISIFVPLLIIFHVMLFAFSIEPKDGFSLAAASISAILGYRFVIGHMSPNTGYFMLSDFMFFIFLGIGAFIFLFCIADMLSDKITLFHKQIVVVLINLFVFIICTYVILFWP